MSESRPSFLLVDGNNIIHAWPELLEMHRRSRGSAHAELISRLESYRDFSGDQVVVVFDGRGTTTQDERPPGGIQIFYTSAAKTADDVIERLAIKYASKYDITVATNDVPEQDIVVGAGGMAISAEMLKAKLDVADRSMRDWIERNRKRR
ncbi:MAG: NYN domain-containing protein [Verrucomicrobiales bacterium]|jgi:predicted RNA-binding protein with PIN domain|nr:NYN domain-containing protein [Verrucomicrobiales bacterium]